MTNNKKINLFFPLNYVCFNGGAPRSASSIISNFAHLNEYNINVLLPNHGEISYKLKSLVDIHTTETGLWTVNPKRMLFSVLTTLNTLRQFKKYLKRADVTIINDPVSLLYASIINRESKIIYISRGFRYEKIWALLATLISAKVDIAVGVSYNQTRILNKKFKRIKSEPLTILNIPDGIYHHRSNMSKYNIEIRKIVFACIAQNFDPNKNQLAFIKWIEELSKLNIEVSALIFGDDLKYPNYFAECMSYISKKKLSNIKCLGVKKNILEYMSNIDVVVIPSISEGLPRVFIDAIMTGCLPIVDSKQDWSQGLVDGRYKCGIKVDFSDPKCSAKEFILGINNINKIDNYMNEATRFRHEIQPKTVMKKYIDQINELLICH